MDSLVARIQAQPDRSNTSGIIPAHYMRGIRCVDSPSQSFLPSTSPHCVPGVVYWPPWLGWGVERGGAVAVSGVMIFIQRRPNSAVS